MFCPNCGKEERDPTARFCNNCGQELKREDNGNQTYQYGPQNTVNNPQMVAGSIHAGFFLRLFAFIIDTVIWVLIFGVLSFGRAFTNPQSIQGLSFILGLLINSAFESSEMMGTPGKYILKIAVVDLNRERITFGKAFVRNLCEYLNAFTLGIGYLMIAFTQNKQGLHDMIAGTYVIKKGR